MRGVDESQYENYPKVANQIREYGKQMNTALSSVQQALIDMQSNWYGQRYVDLITAFNKLPETLNKMLTLVITEIPYNLETVANNYASWDTGEKPYTADETKITEIQKITPNATTGIKFIYEAVSSVQEQTNSNFNTANNMMDSIAQVFNTIVWESDSAKTFKAKFGEMKGNIEQTITDIQTAFKKSIEDTIEGMKQAEAANTLN